MSVIKNKYYGVGFNSGGKYKVKEHGRDTRAYYAWRAMLQRCYSTKYQESKPTYIGCTVNECWHDFQEFAEWYYGNGYANSGFEIDKDLITKGNKEYSPDNCCLVPQEINSMLGSKSAGSNGGYTGVSQRKDSGIYYTQISISGKKKHLGHFKTPEEAFAVYKKAKEDNVKRMADLWFGNIDPRVYEALMDWTLDS